MELAPNGQRQPLARVWEDTVANPNLREQDRPVKQARSAGRLDAALARLVGRCKSKGGRRTGLARPILGS